jgi:anti-sigma factor RsiW
MSPAELLAADDHLGACENCRKLLSGGEKEQTAFAFLQAGLRADADDAHHLLYEQLVAYVDDSADEVECEVIESHVGICTTCATELEDLRALSAETDNTEEVH